MKAAAAILAGGHATRMGCDKSRLTIGSTTILDRIVTCLAVGTQSIILNSNQVLLSMPGKAILAIVPDVLQQVKTPLAGIHAALSWGKTNGYDWITTVPSDTPFLPSDLQEKLIAAAAETGAAIASSGGQRHYVIGAWSTGLAIDLEDAISSGMFRVSQWAERARAGEVEWPAKNYDPFFNVNTPEDLAEARRLAAEFNL